MAHGTPLGIGDNDEHYGAQGAFLIEAGISSSYHIANFFGLTGWIHQAQEKQEEKPQAKPHVNSNAISTGVAKAAAPDIATVLSPLATLSRHPEPPGQRSRRAIDVGAVITRALTAAGLMK
jgi:hypothetical protein